jgi:hypothetical protein
VVKQLDAKQLAGALQTAGGGSILRGWLRVTRRVIMSHNN